MGAERKLQRHSPDRGELLAGYACLTKCVPYSSNKPVYPDFSSVTRDKPVEHIARDLLNRRIAAANQVRMEPGIAALRADRGSVVDPIVRLDSREVIVEAPAHSMVAVLKTQAPLLAW